MMRTRDRKTGRGESPSRFAVSLRRRWLAPALALAVLLYTPAANPGGPIIPDVAAFGGEILGIYALVEASYDNMAEFGIGIGVSVDAEFSGFESMPLGSRGPLDRFLDALIPAAYASNPPSSNTWSYDSLDVRILSDVPFDFSDFASGNTLTIADDQVDPPAMIANLCPVGDDGVIEACDYLWAQGSHPETVSPAGVLEMDSTVVNGVQRGVNVVLTAGSDFLNEPIYEPDGSGDVPLEDLTQNSIMYLDLIDASIGPEAYVRLTVELDNVAITLPPPGGEVPSLSNSGGAFLVIAVGFFGILLLVFPRRKQAPGA